MPLARMGTFMRVPVGFPDDRRSTSLAPALESRLATLGDIRRSEDNERPSGEGFRLTPADAPTPTDDDL